MEMIAAEARKCKFCGEILDPVLRELEILKRQQHVNATSPVVVNNNNNNNNNNNDSNCLHTAHEVIAAVVPPVITYPPKKRSVYVILGIFLGILGAHNFYANRTGAAVCQLLITLFLGWLEVPLAIVFIWAIIEVIAVDRDGRGTPFI